MYIQRLSGVNSMRRLIAFAIVAIVTMREKGTRLCWGEWGGG